MADRRRAGILALLFLLAGGLALAGLPGVGAARLFGVGLLWWYCVVVAPGLALLVALVTLPMTPTCLIASTSPALVATLVARVFAGAPGAPLLVLAAAVAPLLGVLAAPAIGRRDHVAGGAGLASAGLLVWASFLLAGDLAVALGGERWPALAIGGALALVAGVPGASRLRGAVLAMAVAVLATPVLFLTAWHVSPWQAWAGLASRPSLRFEERDPATNEGTVLRVPATLEFAEPHRVTALSQALYRVVERDGEAPNPREWRLVPGDALMLRPGDRLELGAGVQVRFEAGKRIPGASMSGPAWADPADRNHTVIIDVAAAALTLAAGAAALVGKWRPGRRAGRSGFVLLATLSVPIVLALLAASWGVYGASAAPELTLGAPAVAAMAGLPALLPGVIPPAAALGMTLVALGALFAAGVNALGERILELGGARAETTTRLRLGWAAIVLVAAGLAVLPFDAWRALTWGWGLAAAAVVAPALAGEGARATRAAAITGALVFAGLAVGGRTLVPWAPVIAEYPALVAAPIAWGVAAVLGRRLPARRAVRVR